MQDCSVRGSYLSLFNVIFLASCVNQNVQYRLPTAHRCFSVFRTKKIGTDHHNAPRSQVVMIELYISIMLLNKITRNSFITALLYRSCYLYIGINSKVKCPHQGLYGTITVSKNFRRVCEALPHVQPTVGQVSPRGKCHLDKALPDFLVCDCTKLRSMPFENI